MAKKVEPYKFPELFAVFWHNFVANYWILIFYGSIDSYYQAESNGIKNIYIYLSKAKLWP